MNCSQCNGDLGVVHYRVGADYVCDDCDRKSYRSRIEEIVFALGGLNSMEKDVMLEAARQKLRLTPGPNTYGDADRLLVDLGLKEPRKVVP